MSVVTSIVGRTLRGRFHIFLLVVLAAAILAPAAWMMSHSGSPAVTAPRKLDRPALVIASINTMMVTDAEAIAGEIRSAPALREADVLLLQEVVRESHTSAAEALAQRLGWHVQFASPSGDTTISGLGIVSRLPLRDVQNYRLAAQKLVFRSRIRIALAASVATPAGTVRVINTHLDTRINPGQRLRQLAPALEDAQSFRGPVVIAGDFNTNDMQWVSNVVPVPFPGWQASRVRELMRSQGFDTPFVERRATFDHLGMQLDWIYTKGLHTASSGIQPLNFSDHHAVWAQLVVQPNQTPDGSR